MGGETVLFEDLDGEKNGLSYCPLRCHLYRSTSRRILVAMLRPSPPGAESGRANVIVLINPSLQISVPIVGLLTLVENAICKYAAKYSGPWAENHPGSELSTNQSGFGIRDELRGVGPYRAGAPTEQIRSRTR